MQQKIFFLALLSFICHDVMGVNETDKITVTAINTEYLLYSYDYPQDDFIKMTLNESDAKNYRIDLLTFQVNGKASSGNVTLDCVLSMNEDCDPVVSPKIENDKITVNLIDFEEYFSFTITLLYNNATYDIYVMIENYNDEDPSIVLEKCKIMENDIDGNCEMVVSDPDGFLKDLQFTIKDSVPDNKDGYSAEECFQIDKITEEDYRPRTKTALSLKKPLNFKARSEYVFDVVVKDGDRPELFSFTFTVKVIEELFSL